VRMNLSFYSICLVISVLIAIASVGGVRFEEHAMYLTSQSDVTYV
jgi:hypothetical protein